MENVEDQIVRVGADVAPRLTPDRINATIAGEQFHRLTDTLTVCVLTLRNGFTVTGESACASPANYNQEVGERVARSNATEKVWLLEEYLLKQRLFEDSELHKFASDWRTAPAASAAKPSPELEAPACDQATSSGHALARSTLGYEDTHVRLRLLELANEGGQRTEEIVKRAKAFQDFVFGTQIAEAPASE